MHKTKKKTKTAKLPKPIKVKKEKCDEDRLPQPMSHYIDDRLEMVKQIFGSLKPKTIVNLAPDFLKVQALEEIEEACLNELLCISTKRLKSIITGTRCPTDTESSDNDSDVERHEEHISLEEISSDSELEGGVSKKSKKKKSSKNVETAELKTKKDIPKTSEPTAEGGQISVLELLELQARARAIRSQLALEPVTKIEVDSDEDKRNGGAAGKELISNKNDRKRLSSDKESRESAKESKTNGSSENTQANDKDSDRLATKKFKIKRNYQSSSNNQDNQDVPKQMDSYREDKEKEKKSKEKRKETKKNRKEEKTRENKKVNKEENPIIKDIKKERTSRSPSPDVIPIVAEPETLLVADSSDEGDTNLKNTTSTDINDNAREQVLEAESTMDHQRERKNTAPTEEGELDKPANAFKTGNDDAKLPSPKTNKTGEEKLDEKKTEENSSNDNGDSTQNSELQQSDNNDAQHTESKRQNKKKEASNESAKVNEESNSTNHSDDDQNDDVISLGGDLETEMNEQLENEVNAITTPREENAEGSSRTTSKKSQEEYQNEDVISLESSEDENMVDNQSWHSRYMKSSKVSKVLAASRLAKRVRDKIKTSKRSKKETSRENSECEKEKSTPVFTSKHEDGSVDQYKELMEVRQRKSQ